MTLMVVSGTGTGVGKTVVTAAIAANAIRLGQTVAVAKPAQTGVAPGEAADLYEVERLSGVTTTVEYSRFPDPLAPAAAARAAGKPTVELKPLSEDIRQLADDYDLVLVEGAGGLLVRFDDSPTTIADLAGWLNAPIVLVVHAGLGTLNHTELTLSFLQAQSLTCSGIVIGSWPRTPDLAARCNLRDLETIFGHPLSGAVPSDAGQLTQSEFAETARISLDESLGGEFNATAFRTLHDPTPPKEDS